MADSISGHSGYADSTIPLKARITQTRSQEERDPKPPTTSGTTTPRLSSRPTYMTGTTAQSQNSNSNLSFLQSTNATKDVIDLDEYFVGPRDPDRHSKLPYFLRLHGSVLPKMILPLVFMTVWSTLVTCISELIVDIGISSILLTVLGFVVGLSLSFRSSTAYERYAEGRKYWSTLIQASRNLARTIWIHTTEREGEQGKEDLLAKLTGINLIIAFSIAVKHKLRFEPDVAYDDLQGLVGYLDTFAKTAHASDDLKLSKKSSWKAAGEYLGVSFAESNPRKVLKRAKKPLGNLPLEIIVYLSAYLDKLINNEMVPIPAHQSDVVASINAMNDVLAGTERVLNTPLPLAYRIAISQITWIYVLVLPFQLHGELFWFTIPGTIIATYIILGIALIGREIENPFGNDVNDLPLDSYCQQIASELDVITASPKPDMEDFMTRQENNVLFPLSMSGYSTWKDRSVEDIHAALRAKATIGRGGNMAARVEPVSAGPMKEEHRNGSVKV